MRFIHALAIAVWLAAPAAFAEVPIAPGGPCAVAPQRDACAEGACTKMRSKARGRFSPGEVAEGGETNGGEQLPSPPPFDGPGSCADPSNPCGDPAVVTLNRIEQPSPEGPDIPPVAPPPNDPPAPPTPPASPPVASNPTPPTPPPPTTPPGGTPPPPAPPTPPSPPPVSAPPPPPPAPPAPPVPTPPPPPDRGPPPAPPVVVEPPPGPVLPPGVPTP